ncbi:hypothetical protein O0L34_g8274 [Tuta absoluta]|nr:hypothetical protein O0L34_g8274 [Tuta absoluta]
MKLLLLILILAVLSECLVTNNKNKFKNSLSQLRFDSSCDGVCVDLPKNDDEPVCMMFSRYKKYYQFFINECHARRAICKENLLLHLVHKSRCFNSNQYFMPIN